MIVTKNIEFIPVNNISVANQQKAADDLQGIDIKDVPFLALAYQENACLWTGDKKLAQGLHHNAIQIFTTNNLYSTYF